ncbi:protein transport protein S31 [Ascosphaera acerosa]|nr:protein transport protein S31 [Ascosphaera acerosa]
MVRLREIPRTATFAWSPFAASSGYVATGTRSGAVDADFSSETSLEIWNLGLDAVESGETELAQPVGRFNDIAWASSEEVSNGIIAGALENGALDLWNADKLMNGESDPLISRVAQHSGAIKTLQFNPKHSNLLATAGAKAELFVCDLTNADSAFRLGNRVARSDDIDCLDWNRRVPHILVTGSSGGFVTVWDVKTKKETLTLSNLNRRPVSAIAWDPERPTKLITGTPSQNDPIICVWDLRNSNAPERILRGHENGVLDLAWCVQDPRILLSCGMDDRTIAWNPETGDKYGEYPIVTNWTFQTRFNPHNPNIFATASFDGKIAVQTLQNTSTVETEKNATGVAERTDGEDFFNKAHSQPQVSTFSLPTAPRWFERPCGATFGFGGKIISIGLVKGTRTSQIKITPFEVDADIKSAAQNFDKALDAGDLRAICGERIQRAQTDEEKADWKVIETLISKAPKKKLVEYLGLLDSADEAANSLGKLGLGPSASSAGSATADTESPATPGTPAMNSMKSQRKHKRIASIFEPSSESAHFLSDLTLTKSVKSNDPFHILSGQESDTDRSITRALMLGDFSAALDVALKNDRMSDAFMIAIMGGEECVRRAQEYYLTRPKAEGESVPSYSRLLSSIAGHNLWDVVHNADLANWKEAVATICTYSDVDDENSKQFDDLCEVLGDRLIEEFRSSGGDGGEKQAYRKDASFCYLISSKLEKVVSLWIEELQESEARNIQAQIAGASGASAPSSSFSIHAHALQDLIEKVTVFRRVTNFEDPDHKKEDDWKLSQLYEKYVEYANIIAAHGCMNVAEKYLELLPLAHPDAKVAMDRIKLATRPAPITPTHTAAVTGGRTTAASAAARGQRPAAAPAAAAAAPSAYAPRTPYAPAAPVATAPITTPAPLMPAGAPTTGYPAAPAATPRNPYAPPATATATTPANSYAPAASRMVANPYAPAAPTAYGMGGGPAQQSPAAIPPPPRQGSVASPPTGQSFAQASNLPAWNDIPEDLAKKSSASRRSTPAVIASPYAPAPAVGMQSPMTMGMGMHRRGN